MAKKKSVDTVPRWVSQMGMLTDGTQTDPETGEVYPIGLEISDPRPVAIPAGMQAPPSLQEQMAELFRIGRLREAANQEETVDEANDFDIDDYFAQGDNLTPWQVEYDPLLDREISPAEFHEKYKSGELLEELRSRFAKLDREEEVEDVIRRLDAAYADQVRPKKPDPKPNGGGPAEPAPTSANPPPAAPAAKS